MTTHYPHFHTDYASLNSANETSARKFALSLSDVADRPSTTSSMAVLALGYMLSLAALAVVSITGQFPWFLLTLAGGAAIVAAVPIERRETHATPYREELSA